MKKYLPIVFVVIVCNSCFLFKDYRKKEFVYNRNGQSISQPFIVPKGYVKEQKKDTAGITLHLFNYPGGTFLYAAYLTDTTYELQALNKTSHQPLTHRLGGLVYKGQDANELFYREIRQGHLRFGYRYVPLYLEPLFDSATNFASLQKK